MSENTLVGLAALGIPLLAAAYLMLRRQAAIFRMVVAMVLIGLGYLTATGAISDIGAKIVGDATTPVVIEPTTPAAPTPVNEVAPTAAPTPDTQTPSTPAPGTQMNDTPAAADPAATAPGEPPPALDDAAPAQAPIESPAEAPASGEETRPAEPAPVTP